MTQNLNSLIGFAISNVLKRSCGSFFSVTENKSQPLIAMNYYTHEIFTLSHTQVFETLVFKCLKRLFVLEHFVLGCLSQRQTSSTITNLTVSIYVGTKADDTRPDNNADEVMARHYLEGHHLLLIIVLVNVGSWGMVALIMPAGLEQSPYLLPHQGPGVPYPPQSRRGPDPPPFQYSNTWHDLFTVPRSLLQAYLKASLKPWVTHTCCSFPTMLSPGPAPCRNTLCWNKTKRGVNDSNLRRVFTVERAEGD